MATEEIRMGAKWRRAIRRAGREGRLRVGRSAAMTTVVAALLIVGLGSAPASTVARRLAVSPQAQTPIRWCTAATR